MAAYRRAFLAIEWRLLAGSVAERWLPGGQSGRSITEFYTASIGGGRRCVKPTRCRLSAMTASERGFQSTKRHLPIVTNRGTTLLCVNLQSLPQFCVGVTLQFNSRPVESEEQLRRQSIRRARAVGGQSVRQQHAPPRRINNSVDQRPGVIVREARPFARMDHDARTFLASRWNVKTVGLSLRQATDVGISASKMVCSTSCIGRTEPLAVSTVQHRQDSDPNRTLATTVSEPVSLRCKLPTLSRLGDSSHGWNIRSRRK